MDALWVHTLTGRPTINGHSGNQPPDWPFLDMPTNSPDDRRKVGEALERWKRLSRIDHQDIRWIEIPGP